MTFSIVAYDSHTGAAGVATATGEMCVGGYVPYVKAGVGACATQGNFTNWLYGEKSLVWLEQEQAVSAIVNDLKSGDRGFQHRQFLIVNKTGLAGGWTGNLCLEHKGQIHSNWLAVAGNMLSNSDVLPAILETYQSHKKAELSERLLLSLKAGQRAGGDARGLVSAALKIDYLEKAPIDLRIDYTSGDAIDELQRLLERLNNSPFTVFYNSIPTRINPNKPEKLP